MPVQTGGLDFLLVKQMDMLLSFYQMVLRLKMPSLLIGKICFHQQVK
jgi:hypothetical protein